jgi:UDPglucose 6-dehydrogenase
LRNEVLFLCLPTPIFDDGTFDINPLRNCIEQIDGAKILVIKSTITPVAAESLVARYPQHSFVFNPEFLSEKTSVEDFKNQKRIVLGSEDTKSCERVESIYRHVFPNCHYIKTDIKTSCFIKYFCNCFFAAKVSLMNEFYQVSQVAGIDWDVALDGLLSSEWVNPMHTMVPGPDGHLGYGGKCFPKDVQAFIDYSKSLGVDPKIQQSSWQKNLEIRSDRNWEKIEGACTKK